MQTQKTNQEKQRQKSAENTAYHQIQQHETDSHVEDVRRCPRCGAPIEAGQKFCEECGAPVEASLCPHCHQEVDMGLALCPHCGRPLCTDKCSFCGEALEDDESFCTSCGNPRQGIKCPTCGTLNFRSFCRHCNTPLNELAQKAIEKARRHPIVARTKQLAQELQELQERIQQMVSDASLDDVASVLPDEQEQQVNEKDVQLLDRYKRLFASANLSVKKMTAAVRPQKAESSRRKPLIDKEQLKAAIDAYEAKAAAMQSALDQLLPDPADPPEEQRNFLCACLTETYSTVVTRERVTTGWVCNFCGCHHNTPSNCARPELGGRWLYEDKEVKQTIAKTSVMYL